MPPTKACIVVYFSYNPHSQQSYLFVDFLSEIQKDAKIIFIVGDLFDFWFEYRKVIPKGYHKVLAKFLELRELGIEIIYLVGNHDCLMRDYFEKELDVRLHRKPFEVILNNKKFYFHHGDGLSRKDIGYKILRSILRNKFCQWLFSWIHPDIGMSLGKYSSKKSRRYTSKKYYGTDDGCYLFAKKKIEEGFDFVLMGHKHEMVYEKIGNGVYINLGDWITHYSYATFDGDYLTLKKIEKNI